MQVQVSPNLNAVACIEINCFLSLNGAQKATKQEAEGRYFHRPGCNKQDSAGYSKYTDAVGLNLNNSRDNINQLLLVGIRDNLDCPPGEGRYDRGMVFQDLKRSFCTRHLHEFHFSIEKLFFRGNDFKFHDQPRIELTFLGLGYKFFSLGDGLLNGTYHMEGRLRVLINLTVHDHVKTFNGIFN